MRFLPRPAPLQRRVVAGLIDAAFVVVLCGISFAVPLLTRGLVLPMWGVLAVMVGYAVVPLAFLKRTLGLHIMGLELVGKTGHPVDLANLLFRELLGRGFFPAAWLFTIVSSLVASSLRVGGSTAPPVLAGLMTVASAGALCVAAIGHLVALGRPDQRTLADLISGSFVVEAPALPAPSDPDEAEAAAGHRRSVLGRIAVFELVLMGSVLALPWFLSSSNGETPQQKIARLKLEALEAKHAADPGNEALTAELQRAYLLAGRKEDSQRAFERHRQALSLKEAARELALREQLAARKDRATAEALISLLEKQDRVDDAAEAYRAWLGPSPTAGELAGFGNWLATNNRTEAAVAELQRALALDPLVPFGHTLLGVCLQRLGRLEEAREALELALLDDPDDADADEALREVDLRVGPLPGEKKQELQRRLDGWRKAAAR